MPDTTGLKNPNLKYRGLSIPNNRFEMLKRDLETIDGVTTVEFYLRCYTLNDKSEYLPMSNLKFTLHNMAAEPTVQSYWTALFAQYGETTMPNFDDKTLIKDYTVLTD